MGIRIITALSAIAFSITVSAPAFAQAGSPSAFLHPIYDALGGEDVDSPILRDDRIYSAGLLALMRAADRAATAAGDDVGALDFNPLCNCQDITSSFTIKVLDQNRAKARVLVNMDGGEDAGRQSLTLSLVREAGGWRVDDVAAPPSFRSLRALLRAGPSSMRGEGDTETIANSAVGQRDAHGHVIGVPFRDPGVARNILRRGPGAGYWPRRMVLVPADEVIDDSVVLVPAE